MRARFLYTLLSVPMALALAPAAPTFAQAPPAAPAAPAAPPAPTGVTLSATLNGASEVDAQGASKGDPKGSGSFSGRLVPGKDQFCYTLSWSGIDDPTMAHIHKGATGVNGPVFIGLTELSAGEHCMDLDKERADALAARPQDYYVNIHNGDFPGGAVRGQLAKN